MLVGTLSLAMAAHPVPLAAEPATALEEAGPEGDGLPEQGGGEQAGPSAAAGGGGGLPGGGDGEDAQGGAGGGAAEQAQPQPQGAAAEEGEAASGGGGAAPVASIRLDPEPAPAGGAGDCYATPRMATVTVAGGHAAPEPTVRLPEGAGGRIEVGGWVSGDDGLGASARVTFLDGTYDALRVTATDGGTLLEETLSFEEFTVDTVAPALASLTVTGVTGEPGAPARTWDLAAGEAPEGPLYVRGGAAALRVHVDDAHACGVEVRLGDGTAAGRDLGNGDYEVDLPEGACPELEVRARDEAGNRSAPVAVPAGTLVVDGTAPAIGAVRTSGEGMPPLADAGARLGAGANTLAIEASDANLPEGAHALGARVTLRDGTRRDLAVRETAGGSASTGTRKFALTLPDGSYEELAISATDRAGNACTRTFRNVTVDTVAPRFTIFEREGAQPSGRRGETAYYDRARPLAVMVDEEGLSAEPEDEGYVGRHLTVSNLGRPVGVTWSETKDGRLMGVPDEDGSRDGAYELSVSGTDPAGNEAVPTDGRHATGRFVVDTTSPLVSVSGVTEGLRQGAGWDDPLPYDYLLQPSPRSQSRLGRDLYLRRVVTSLVTVEDANLDLAETFVEVDGRRTSLLDGLGRHQAASGPLSLSWEREGGRCTCLVTYSDDGRGGGDHLTPRVEAHDLAGNGAAAGEGRTPFVVDTHAPGIRLAWEDGSGACNVQGGVAYYSSPRVASVTISERNWDPSQTVGDVIHVMDRDGDESPRSDWDVSADGGDGSGEAPSFRVAFRDGDYGLWVAAHDLAGNRSEDRGTPGFVVDTKAPAVSVSFDRSDALNGRYYATPRTMTVRVVERNFDPARMRVDVSTGGGRSRNVGDPAAWHGEGDVHTLTYAFDRDGTYAVEVGGSDLAGNEAEPVRVDEFTIDRTAPEVSVAPERAPDATFAGVGHYRRPLAWRVEVRDRNLDARADGGSHVTVGRGSAQVGPVGAWRQERSQDGTVTWSTTVLYDELPEGEAGRASLSPEVHAVDLAGNARDESARPFCVDRTAPSVVLASVSREPSSTADGSAYQFYNRPTSMTFRFRDPYGLEGAVLADPDGEYDVRANVERGATEGSLTVELADGTHRRHDTEFERDVTLTVTDVAGNARVWTIDREGRVTDDKGSPARNVSLGGRGIHPLSLIEDVTAPLVSLSGPAAGSYHSAAQTVRVAVDELNFGYLRRFDPGRSVVRVTRREGRAGGARTSYDVPAMRLTGSGAAWGCDVPLAEDGHYELLGHLTDFAGNGSNTVGLGEFTIDGMPPVASLSWDGADARNGRYYRSARTATLTVVEHNFDEGLFSISTTGEVGPWAHDGDTHTCAIRFGEGVHRLSVRGKDLAGNEANALEEPEFVVDTTAPTVGLGGLAQRRGGTGGRGAYEGALQDHSAYNGVVAPQIAFADEANLDAGSVSYALVGGKRGDVTGTCPHSVSAQEGGVTVQFADLGRREGEDGTPYDVDADDVYVLRAQVADLAGNETEAELTFSVNRFGSNYLVSVDGQREGERGGLLTEPPCVRVREISVCGVPSEESRGVLKEYADATTRIGRNDGGGNAGFGLTTVPPGEAGEGYGWSECLYTIRSGNFGEGSDSDHGDGGQGVYRVDVTSDDAASNANSTAAFWASDARRATAESKRATAQFTLDQEAPRVEWLSLPGPVAIGPSCEASFRVDDDITLGNEVEVTVDGRPVEVRGPEDGRGSFSFSIPARPLALREVRVLVRDYAGRTAEAGGARVLVTSPVPEALAMAAVGGTVLGVHAGRRRRARARGRAREGSVEGRE